MPFQTHFDFRHPTRIVHGPGSIACLVGIEEHSRGVFKRIASRRLTRS